MTSLNVPNSITNGTVADATDVQQNFDAIESHVNAEVINRDGSIAMTGELLLPSNPTSNLAASTKSYVDGLDNAMDTRVTALEGTDITVEFDTGSDLDGSFTITNLGNVVNTTVSVRDDSHNHTIANVDGLQTALDGKQASGSYLTTSTNFSGDVSGAYNNISLDSGFKKIYVQANSTGIPTDGSALWIDI